jgi:hypothetical protein
VVELLNATFRLELNTLDPPNSLAEVDIIPVAQMDTALVVESAPIGPGQCDPWETFVPLSLIPPASELEAAQVVPIFTPRWRRCACWSRSDSNVTRGVWSVPGRLFHHRSPRPLLSLSWHLDERRERELRGCSGCGIPWSYPCDAGLLLPAMPTM